MVLGMSLAAFTALHVAISLAALASGAIMLVSMAGNRPTPRLTALYLLTIILTSVTGFMFPPKPIGPPHVFGAVSLVLLAITLLALYRRKLAGAWRWIYVVGVAIAFYLNAVVTVVQAFQKLPTLNAIAPAGTEPPFLAAQLTVLLLTVGVTFLAVRRYRPSSASAAAATA